MTATTDATAGASASAASRQTAGRDGEPLAFTARDGLVLRGRKFAASAPSVAHRRPALCLAGLTRNGRDFNALVAALSSGPAARDVYTLDMRGRGASDWDKNWRNYAILVELGDTLDFMTVHGLHDAAIIGTSRGGLIAMGMMAVQPTRAGAIVLNDIGPVIEAAGLKRIAGYVGTMPKPGDWAEAADMIRRGLAREFTALSDDDVMALARQWYNEDANGGPAPGYDPAIARTFAAAKDGIPALWPQFEAVTRVPCLTLRGANSDLLSAETVTEMGQRHPRLRAVTVANEGHAPLLRDTGTIAAISAFLTETDATGHARDHA